MFDTIRQCEELFATQRVSTQLYGSSDDKFVDTYLGRGEYSSFIDGWAKDYFGRGDTDTEKLKVNFVCSVSDKGGVSCPN